MRHLSVRAILAAALAASLGGPARADNIATCLGNAARIVQFAPQIGDLRSKAEAKVQAANAANPNMDDAKAEEMLAKAYAPMMNLCEKLQVRETVGLCSSILSARTAGDRTDQVTQASQALQVDPIGTCYAQ
jgi:nucleoid-associated protein YgaU